MPRAPFTFTGVPSALLALALVACGGKPSSESACAQTSVDRFKELTVVDEGVLSDARARNTTSGAWSFRHAIEQAAPPGVSAGDLVLKWLREWGSLRDFNGYPLDVLGEYRTASMERLVVCPWLKHTSANGCNDDCSSCAAQTLDLGYAPFRLIAIVNRMDLREQPNFALAGESRLVFALTNGPSDDPSSKPQPMTVIFEYGLPKSRSPQEWARAWHDLGQIPTFDEPYRAALQAVTDGFVGASAEPSKPNGSALDQIRTNESVLDWMWQMRQFELGADGYLHTAPTRDTPSESLNETSALGEFINANSTAVLAGHNDLPSSMSAGSVYQLKFSWNAPTVDDKLRKAFAKNTCNGCHSEQVPSVDLAFHVSPFRSNADKLSKFLNDPENSEGDELSNRTASLRRALCAQ